jgi:predicted SprT family Zn-dependent metalloprotease
MNLLEVEQLAKEKMSLHGLIQAGWKFSWNKRKRAAGVCNRTKRTIFLSTVFASAGIYEDVLDTILHEIAHALTPGHHHDIVWKRKAIEVGAKPNRCFNQKTKYKGIVIQPTYQAVCPNGHISNAFRRPKKRRSCGRCSSSLNPAFLLNYEKVEKEQPQLQPV